MCAAISGLWKQEDGIVVWFRIILSKIFSTKKIYKSWRIVNFDVLVQNVEHGVPVCVVQHLALSAGH